MNVPANKISLRNLKSFGDVAASDDSVLDYFLQTDAVDRIIGDKVIQCPFDIDPEDCHESSRASSSCRSGI
jgi:hypothetical protein